jgi:hypothetical protein
MSQIRGIQKREPYSHSSGSKSNYDHYIESDEFSIKKYKNGDIEIFFKRSSSHTQGVGLHLPSTKLATAFGRALLLVSEGYSDDVTISTS